MIKPNCPKMIMFDYGHTLLYERDYDPLKGNAELLKYAVKNKNNLTAKDIQKYSDIVFNKCIGSVNEIGYEISAQVGDRFLFDYLGIELSLSPLEAENIYWSAALKGEIMPHTDKMLSYINSLGIRSAVISNIVWSGDALTDRIKSFLPDNKFEFIIASSDYMFRKPNRFLFELALNKAGLDASEVWYCGDNPQVDIEGAAQAGIFPVWYTNSQECFYRDKSKETDPQCEHLHIKEWDELIQTLDGLQKKRY